MNKAIRWALGATLALVILLGALATMLIVTGRPGRSETLHFDGFIKLPNTSNAGMVSVLDFLTVSGSYVYVTGVSTGAVYKAPLQVDTSSNKDDTAVLEGTPSVHDIVFDPATGYGFVTRSGADAVDIFDPKTMQSVKRIHVAPDPDAILFDFKDKMIYAASAESRAATLIDPVSQNVVATIPLGGQGEFAVFDPQTALVYQNLSDTNTLATVDLTKHAVVRRLPLTDCSLPTGMALDAPDRRLFIACAKSSKLLIVAIDENRIIASCPIAFGTDSVAYDPQLRRIYTAGLLGRMTIVDQKSADAYRAVETLALHFNAHTLTIDPATHRLYVGYTGFLSPPRIAVFTPIASIGNGGAGPMAD